MTNRMIAWVDVESTGTSPDRDMILEIAGIVTDMQGRQYGDSFSALVDTGSISEAMRMSDPVARMMHEESGLWSDLWNNTSYAPDRVDHDMSDWLTETAGSSHVVLGGNSPYLDRGLMAVWMPVTYSHLSHMSVDVTSVSMMLQDGVSVSGYRKSRAHRALADAQDSLDEYRYYLDVVKSMAEQHK
jgi:oligoribonuclease